MYIKCEHGSSDETQTPMMKVKVGTKKSERSFSSTSQEKPKLKITPNVLRLITPTPNDPTVVGA
jgi:hypothetical protein